MTYFLRVKFKFYNRLEKKEEVLSLTLFFVRVYVITRTFQNRFWNGGTGVVATLECEENTPPLRVSN